MNTPSWIKAWRDAGGTLSPADFAARIRRLAPFLPNPTPRPPVARPEIPPPPPEQAELSAMMNEHHADPLLGDLVEAWAKRWGADKAAAAWETWTGLPCGCDWRKGVLNQLDSLWRGVWGRISGRK